MKVVYSGRRNSEKLIGMWNKVVPSLHSSNASNSCSIDGCIIYYTVVYNGKSRVSCPHFVFRYNSLVAESALQDQEMLGILLRVIFASVFACLTYGFKSEAKRIPAPIITRGLRPRLTSAVDSNWWRCIQADYLDYFGMSYVSSSALRYSDAIVQHTTNRQDVPVLCVEGLCATEYHLLLVDGEDVSMGVYCQQNLRSCILSKATVNNLKAVANEVGKTRWKHVYITSYDIRLPFWMVWVMQGIEDFFQLFMETISLPGLTAGAAAAAVDAENMMYFGGDRDV